MKALGSCTRQGRGKTRVWSVATLKKEKTSICNEGICQNKGKKDSRNSRNLENSLNCWRQETGYIWWKNTYLVKLWRAQENPWYTEITRQYRQVFDSPLCSVWFHKYALFSVCRCVHVSVCDPKWEPFDRFSFCFLGSRSKSGSLKLSLRVLYLCVIAEQNETSSLMWSQTADFPLCNTISQVRAVSAAMKLNPVARALQKRWMLM